MKDWAKTFEGPIFLPTSEQDFIVNPTDKIQLWKDDLVDLWDGIQSIKIGGHFP